MQSFLTVYFSVFYLHHMNYYYTDLNKFLCIMKIVIWLWNPWIEYSKTRHNTGFMFLDFLREKLGFEEFKDSKFKALISEWVIDWEKIILLKPMTYMNLSWESVLPILSFFKLDFKSEIIVIFDDISLDFGKIRFRDKWRDWWHNGIKSIIQKLGSDEFKRIKIWVSLDPKFSVSDWVLSKFDRQELDLLEKDIFEKGYSVFLEQINK